MSLRRAIIALVCGGLVLVALAIDPHRPAAAEADPSVPTAEEPTTVPAPPGAEPAEPHEEPATAGDESGTPGDPPTAGNVPPAAEDPDEAQAPAAVHGIVQVVVTGAGEEIRRTGSGFVVQAGYVVTAAHVVEDEDRISVMAPSDAGMLELVAHVHHVARRADLALLVVRSGLELEPLVLAKDGFEVGRNVVSTGFWDPTNLESVSRTASRSAVESRGAVGEHPVLDMTRDDAAVDLLRHNAMIPIAGYGGPLLNDCREVVGVNRGDPEVSRRALRRGEPPQKAVYAAQVSAIVGLLQPAGVTFTRTESSCADPLSVAQAEKERAAEEARRAGEERDRAKEDAARLTEEKETEAAEKEAELDQAREKLDAASEDVEDLTRQLEEAERTGAEGVELLRDQLEAAEATQVAAQQKVDGLEGEIRALRHLNEGLEGQLEQERQNQVIIIAVAVAAVLLLAVVAGVLYRRRSLELAHVRQQVGAGHGQAPGGRTGLGEASGANGPEYLLSGETGDGNTVSLKVLGSMVASGVVIGRSPRNATLLIDDKTLSRAHARLYEGSDGALYVEDLGTTNGTRVNGRLLQPGRAEPLRRGDTVQFGEVTLRLI